MKQLLSKNFIVILFGLLIFLLPGKILASADLEERILEFTNEARVEQGLEKLQENVDLKAAAEMKLDNMIEHNYFAHTSPLGTTPWYFMNQADYQFSIAGENLAQNYFSPRLIVDAWLDSAEHRTNLLNPNFKEVGIAMDAGNVGGQETTLVVQMFGNREDFIPSAEEEVTKTEYYIFKPKLNEPKIQATKEEEPFALATWIITGLLILVIFFIILLFVILLRRK
ncbi:MAG: CAP domain-containing protein [bacterium]